MGGGKPKCHMFPFLPALFIVYNKCCSEILTTEGRPIGFSPGPQTPTPTNLIHISDIFLTFAPYDQDKLSSGTIPEQAKQAFERR